MTSRQTEYTIVGAILAGIAIGAAGKHIGLGAISQWMANNPMWVLVGLLGIILLPLFVSLHYIFKRRGPYGR